MLEQLTALITAGLRTRKHTPSRFPAEQAP
jgi:hypothetical protein